MTARFKMCVTGARQVVQVTASAGVQVLTGAAMNTLAVFSAPSEEEGVGLLVDSDGKICLVGTDRELKEKTAGCQVDKHVDARGCCLLPGFVDGHTHAVWVGDRVGEFAMKLAGATYMEVHAAGGGINFTVERVREATEDTLYAAFQGYARRMLMAGTTTAEVKSGYGLDGETELKMLRVLHRATKDPQAVPMDISATYCGAHSVPKGKTAAEATEDIVQNQIPRIASLMGTGELTVHNIDVFCERGVFDVEQTVAILKAGAEVGLAANFHGEELHRLHSAEAGAALGARAISHLEEVSDEGIAAMAQSGTVAVVLPTTAYMLRLTPPPVRKMIEAGVPVALGSDFNPNAHCLAMPTVLHLACVLLRMTMPEALVAATINAAASVGLAATHGSLHAGKWADIIVVEAPRWEHIVYQLGGSPHLIKHVIKKGNIVHTRPDVYAP